MEDLNSNLLKRGGRPPAENPRKYTLSTKLTRDELSFVINRIRQSGMSRSEALRLLILNEELPKVVHKGIDVSASTAYQNLQPLQSNLNQIAHALNIERLSQIPPEGARGLLALIRKIEVEVKSLRQEIIGAEGE